MIGKVAVSVTSVILVVGVALAVVAVVHHNASKRAGESLSPQMKVVKDICSKTDFQEACQKSLSPEAFGLEFNIKPSGRRLLSQDGYPTWFSGSDRKLLAMVDSGRVRPNAIVAKDGSGNFKTIAAALAAYPTNLIGRYVIYIKSGVYDEYITVEKNQKNVFMFGDGPRKTIVTGRKSNSGGFTTFKTASFCKFSIQFHYIYLIKILGSFNLLMTLIF
jgi:hypothetical protein